MMSLPTADRVLLPDGSYSPIFRGRHAFQQALETEVTYVGATVHWITAEVDKGDVILKEAISLGKNEIREDLYARLLQLEKCILLEAIKKLLLEKPLCKAQ